MQKFKYGYLYYRVLIIVLPIVISLFFVEMLGDPKMYNSIVIH